MPPDLTSEDGRLGAQYVAELAGDEQIDDGIINFDDLLAHDGRDLQAAVSASSQPQQPQQPLQNETSSPFARRRSPQQQQQQPKGAVAKLLSAEAAGANNNTAVTPGGTWRPVVDIKLT